MPGVTCYDARSYKQKMVISGDNQALHRTKKLPSHHKRRVTYRKMQAHLKVYKPDDKQNQAVQKCHM